MESDIFCGKISLEIVLGFYGENMENKLPIWSVWRLYGENVESDIFVVKLVWRLSWVFFEKT